MNVVQLNSSELDLVVMGPCTNPERHGNTSKTSLTKGTEEVLYLHEDILFGRFKFETIKASFLCNGLSQRKRPNTPGPTMPCASLTLSTFVSTCYYQGTGDVLLVLPYY